MTEDPVMRVAIQAIKCISNFIKIGKDQEHFFDNYKISIMNTLVKFLNTHQTIHAQEVGVRTLIVLIKALNKDFEPYYSTIMGYFRNLMSNLPQQEGETLRGLIVEGASLAGKAVERERFIGDAKFILDEMARVNMLNSNNPIVGCVEAALCTFAEILGEEFTSFMPNVIPYVLEQAGMEVQSREVDKELDNDDDDDRDKNDYYYEGDKIIMYNPSQAREKADSMHAIGVYAYATKANFIPYAEKAFKILLDGLNFKFYEEVPNNAFHSMEHVLRSVALACIHNPSLKAGLQTMIKKILEITTAYIENTELSWGVRIAAIDALKGTFLVIHRELLVVEQPSERVAKALGTVLVPWAEEVKSDSPDDNDEECFFYLFDHVQECIDAILQNQREAFIGPYLTYIHKAVLSLVSNDVEDYPETSLRVLASIAQHTPSQSVDKTLLADILNAHLEMIKSTDGSILQAVFAGLEALIENQRENLHPEYERISAAITEFIRAPIQESSKSTAIAQDMAVVTLGVLIYEYGSRQDSSDLNMFLSKIPLTNCREAGEKANELFCAFTQRYYQRFIGQNNENVPIVIRIFANIIKSGFITQKFTQYTVSLVKSFAESVNEATLLSGLTPELSEIFRNFIRQNST